MTLRKLFKQIIIRFCDLFNSLLIKLYSTKVIATAGALGVTKQSVPPLSEKLTALVKLNATCTFGILPGFNVNGVARAILNFI